MRCARHFFAGILTDCRGSTAKGGYEQSNDVAAVSAWIEDNGYDYAGPMLDIYHVSPHETQNPGEFVIEVCFPVRKKQ